VECFFISVPVDRHSIERYFDSDSGKLLVDWFLRISMLCPGNYGFIPHRLSGDSNPVEELLSNTQAIVPAAFIIAPGQDPRDGGRRQAQRKDPRSAGCLHQSPLCPH
jgi:hypothetical protein